MPSSRANRAEHHHALPGAPRLARIRSWRSWPFTTLRSLAVNLLRLHDHTNIAAANRHHARDPQRTLKLLQTA
jgi:hypothetical protein